VSTITSERTFETIITGDVGWEITPKGSTEPSIEALSGLEFYRTAGPSTVDKRYDVLYQRFPGDSNHKIKLRNGFRTIFDGTLEIVGPRGHANYARYTSEGSEGPTRGPFSFQLDDTEWTFEMCGSWLNADHSPDQINTLPEVLRQFPDIQPFDPADVGTQLLLAYVSKI